ncbi:MAG TPA: hypothetical protein VGR28_02965 [Candidatus Thermoplasmatota archaeon]|jgi:hypothetical protein|nr:hypothetical protein [Candidatus Thermoplasmatota archaeon]
MGTTSIQIDAKTRQRLARLKSNPRETYDELLNKLMALIPEGDEEGTYADAFRASLLSARLDTAAGRTKPLEHVKRDLGL